MGNTFFLLTLGCAKNLVDSRGIANRLVSAGWRQTEEPEEAALLICNTCAFITPAKEEAIESILSLAEIKKQNPESRLVVCGCFPQRSGEELAAELPEVDLLLGTDAAETILDTIQKSGLFINTSREQIYLPRTGYELLPHGRAAYLKIAEGCDNRCAYCAIPLIRGGYRPRPSQAILNEAKELINRGILELNLISQDTSMYYDPENPEYRLPELLEDLKMIPGVSWIRPLYLHPAHISSNLITTMSRKGALVPYFDIPVQHLSDPLLTRMDRKTNWLQIKSCIETIRKEIPDAVIRTTLILGFPGETEEDVDLLCTRLEEIGFDKLGAFRYSHEEGTPAAIAKWIPMDEQIVENRYNRVMQLQKNISAERLRRFIGSTLPVLIEERIQEDKETESEEILYIGRSIYDAPDVDGCTVVSSNNPEDITGSIVPVHILKASDYDLYGEAQ